MRFSSTAGFIAFLAFTSCAALVPKEQKMALLPWSTSIEASQQKPVWCWAACASMIHKYNGTEMSQTEIAKRIHGYEEGGELKVAAASRYEVYKALSPDSTSFSFDEIWGTIGAQIEEEATKIQESVKNGQKPVGLDVEADPMVGVHAGLDKFFPNRSAPLQALSMEQPAVVGLRGKIGGADGHLCVIVGAKWKETPSWAIEADANVVEFGEGVGLLTSGDVDSWSLASSVAVEASSRLNMDSADIEWIEIVDPWIPDNQGTPENEMRTRLSAQEFKDRVAFVATVKDADAILTRWNELIKIKVETEAIK